MEDQKSIIRSALRAFSVSFFSVLGVLIAIIAIGLLFGWIFSSTTDDVNFSSKVKILPDADGNRKDLGSDVPVLLQINIQGTIGKTPLTGKKIENILLDSREDEFKDGRVKGILLVINSPGGGVTETDIIYRHLKHYQKTYKVPIFAFVDGLSASGGYYIAAAANKIFASSVSLVGSIGVVAWPPFFNLYDALEKLGINSMSLSAGKGKDEMNPFRPWKPNEQENYQQLINFYYALFVDIVVKDRPQINMEKLINNYGAKIFPAPQAEEFGLIDGSGYERGEVLRQLAKEANLEKYQVVSFEAKSWWKKLFKEENRSPLITGKIKHELILPEHTGNPFSYLYTQTI